MSGYAVTDPVTNTVLARYPDATDAQLQAAIERVAAGASAWAARPVRERAAVLREIARISRERRDEIAETMTREMGKRSDEARGEVGLCASIFEYYADHAERLLADTVLAPTGGGTARVVAAPFGVLLGIMPWNYPYYQVARFAAPNLVAGNVIILKHAPNCPESALLIEEILHQAGVPAGAYVNVFATTDQVRTIIEHPAVRGVSLTGSERAGSAVAAIAGGALKKVVLELGGSDPFIVCADADLDAALDAAVQGRFGNAGQACTASKRFIVADAVYERFAHGFAEQIAGLSLAAPELSQPGSIGPLSSEAAAQRVQDQVAEAVRAGAVALVGGARPDRPGAFVAPTLLTEVGPEIAAYHEEIFGPVAVLYRVADDSAAIALANDTPYGLGSVIFSSDAERAERIAAALNVGMVSINASSQTQADLPFGGVGASGFGRELGDAGIGEFLNRKLIRTVGP